MEKENMPAAANKGPKMMKMTHKEHILAKSGMYIGSCKIDGEEAYWVHNSSGAPRAAAPKAKAKAKPKKKKKADSDEDSDESAYTSEEEEEKDEEMPAAAVAEPSSVRMEYRKVRITPGLYKLFDEILVNAADNKERDTKEHVMTELKVTFEATSITVKNNGSGISVAKHEDYPDLYIPEMIFGHLLTSSNYDDSVKQTVGGTNGLGAKLVNIYSQEFIVEIEDAEAGLKYRQVWRNNMADMEKAKITKYSGKSNSTAITFFPDFARFGMADTKYFTRDLIDLFTKRVYDIAGTTDKSLKVFLNNDRIIVNNFKDYMGLYLDATRPAVVEQVDPKNQRWQVGVSVNDSGTFAQVSFVNSIATSRGGKHVDYMEDLVADALLEQIKKKNKTLKDAKPADVKKHLFMFVNARIFNPTFDSQTKSFCTSTRADLQLTVDRVTRKETKEKVVLPESFVKSLVKSGIVAVLVERLTERSMKNLSKTDGKKLLKRLTGIPKLEDANKAGTKDGHLCTLILTEGDSAKALAVSGLSVVGRDHYGVFPLKGKLLNVREASHKQIMENSEVTALKQILGLKSNAKYADARDLRYGHVMIMADQDHDGSHIKGLIINLFAHFWPSLLRLPGFLQEFITPIVKVSKGVSASGVMARGAKEQRFYTLPEYELWKEATQAEKGWTTKYYKGLGTSTAVEAKNYFSDLPKHKLAFSYAGAADDEAIDMAFSRAKADARKDWLGGFEPGTFLSQEAGKLIPYSEFVHKELILFSVASNLRAIPSVIDGFKPGQRKILFAAFKRNLKKEIKVAQLAGYVSENSAYHHGEQSLCATIVGMAQNFVGSNNINLLLPNGQFGTRLQGGKDAASPRYIFTSLSSVARAVFPAADDGLLNYLTDDGQSIEPEFYVPILPMVLVNGSAGIGTGWSSNVPNYDPRGIVANLRRMIGIHDSFAGDRAAMEIPFISQLPELHPHYKGFTGAVKHKGASSYVVKGVIEKLRDGSIHITELPLQKWTGDYKVHLETMLAAGEIKEFREYHTDSRVSFVVELTPEQLIAYESDGMTLYKKFKLNSSLTSSNMVLFDRDGKLKKYASANDILIDFFHVRMAYYHDRKRMMLAAAQAEERKLNCKVRFIHEVNAGTIVIKEGKAKILAALVRGKYEAIPKKPKAKVVGADDEDEEDAQDKEDAKANGNEPRASDYDYLLSMPIWSLTKERADALAKESAAKAAEVVALEGTSPSSMWITDLDTFDVALDDLERNERLQEQAAAERSLEKRLSGVKSEAARKKLRAELEHPVEAGVVVPDYTDDFDEDKPVKEKKPRKNAAALVSAMVDEDGIPIIPVAAEKKEKKTATKKLAPAAPKTSVAAGAKKPAAPRKKKVVSDDDEDESMDDVSDDESLPSSPVAPRAKTGRAAAAKKPVYVDASGGEENSEDDESVEEVSDDDEEEAELMDESDYEMTPVKPKKAPAKVVKAEPKKAASPPPVAKKAPAAAKKAAPKKKKSKGSDSEDEEQSESDFDDGDDAGSDFDSPKKKPAKKAAAPKKAPAEKKQPTEKKAPAEKKPAAEKKPTKAALAKAAAAAAAAEAPSVVSIKPIVASGAELSLADRLAARLANVALSFDAPAPVVAAAPKKKAAAPESPSTPPKKKAVSKREKEAKAPAAILGSPVSPDPKRRKLFNAASSKAALDQAAATPIAKALKAAAPKKGKKAKAVDSDDEEEAESSPVASSRAAAAGRPQRATKPTKSYAEKSDDEEDEDDMSVEEISDDEDY